MVDSTNGVLNVSPCPYALDETLESIAGCCKRRARIVPGPISAGGRLACRSRELSGLCVLPDFFVADYRDRETGGADGVTRTRVRTAGGFPINLKHLSAGGTDDSAELEAALDWRFPILSLPRSSHYFPPLRHIAIRHNHR